MRSQMQDLAEMMDQINGAGIFGGKLPGKTMEIPEEAGPGPKPAPTRSRAEQSRINGAKSQGPKTEEGKAASSQNAVKHRMYSQGILAPGESPAEFEAFRDSFVSELKPVGVVQTSLATRAMELTWKLLRMPVVEAAILRIHNDGVRERDGMGELLLHLLGRENDGILIRLQRYETRLERSLHACLKELRLLKADAAAEREQEQAELAASAALPISPGKAGAKAAEAEPPPAETSPMTLSESHSTLKTEASASAVDHVKDLKSASGSFRLSAAVASAAPAVMSGSFRQPATIGWQVEVGSERRLA